MKLISGVQKAAVYDPATGAVVQLNRLAPDTEVKVREPVEMELGTGGTIYSGEESQFTLVSFDVPAYAQLKNWQDSHTLLRAVLLGVENHLLWYDDVEISVEPHYEGITGKLNMLSLTMKKKSAEQKIYNVKNLLIGAVGNPWPKDTDSNGLVDGMDYSLVSGAAPNFRIDYNRYQAMESAGAGEVVLSMEIEFPLSGVNLFAFPGIYLNDNTFNSHILKALDYSGAVIASATDVNPENLLQLQTPSNTYKLRYELADITLGAAGMLTEFSVPYVGIDPNNYQDVCVWGFATELDPADRITSTGAARITSGGSSRIVIEI